MSHSNTINRQLYYYQEVYATFSNMHYSPINNF